MSADEETRIMAALKDMRIETKADFVAIHQRFNALDRDGCSKATSHEKNDKDHEDRLRMLEAKANQAKGAAWLLNILCGMIGGALTYFASKK